MISHIFLGGLADGCRVDPSLHHLHTIYVEITDRAKLRYNRMDFRMYGIVGFGPPTHQDVPFWCLEGLQIAQIEYYMRKAVGC